MKNLLFVILLFFTTFAFSQKLSSIDSLLRKNFPDHRSSDGWRYFPQFAHLKKLYKPELSKLIPNYRYYEAKMTHYLSYHVDESQCLLVYNSENKTIELIDPIWFSNESIKFFRRFIGKTFNDSVTLKRFISELQSLIGFNSDYPVKNTKYSTDYITFDVLNMNIGGRLWRSYKISMTNFTFKDIEYEKIK